MTEPAPKTLSQATRDLLEVHDRRDRPAFGRLSDHFAPRLNAMTLRGGLRDGTAEDVVQDVMLAVWHKVGQFDPHRADAAGRIYGIARNRRIDMGCRRPVSQPREMPELESTDQDAAAISAFKASPGVKPKLARTDRCRASSRSVPGAILRPKADAAQRQVGNTEELADRQIGH